MFYTLREVSRYGVFLVCIFPNGTEYGEIRLNLGFLKWKPVSTGLSQYSILDIALSVASAITICFNNKQLEYLISIKTKFGGNVARHFLSITSIQKWKKISIKPYCLLSLTKQYTVFDDHKNILCKTEGWFAAMQI